MSNLNEYPQDAAPVKTHRALKVTLAVIGAGVLLTAGTFTGSVALTAYNTAHALHLQEVAQSLVPPAPVGDATTGSSEAQMAASDVAGADAVTAEQQAEAAAALAAQQAAQAAAQAAQAHRSANVSDGKHPAGTPLPFIPSSDPNNANGGDYEDPSIFCDSGSASTVNGIPVCD